jgi:hypothetical protein
VEDLYQQMYEAYLAEQARLREAAKKVKTRAVSTKVREYKRDQMAIDAGHEAGKNARIVQPGEKIGSTRRGINA